MKFTAFALLALLAFAGETAFEGQLARSKGISSSGVNN
jgi:hypothetical protein